MNIGEAVKENTKKSVQCKANSSNPASLVSMGLFIDGKKAKYNITQEIETPGSDNGMVKTFVFMFSTNRSQNHKVVKCRLQWDGKYIKMETKAYLNITCEHLFLDDR